MTGAQKDVYWFAYAEPGLECLEGDPAWGDACPNPPCGCVGDAYELVSLETWHMVELVSYLEGFVIARVYDEQGIPLDVAKIWSRSTRVWDAYVAMEEGYNEPPDPYLTAEISDWHPQWMLWGTSYQDWPSSIEPKRNEINAMD
jgi:hypothetical protein